MHTLYILGGQKSTESNVRIGRTCGQDLTKACCVSSAAVINWGLLVLILYALYYIALEPGAGFSWGLLLAAPMWLTATAFYQHVPHAWAWALGLHILSWFLQVRHSTDANDLNYASLASSHMRFHNRLECLAVTCCVCCKIPLCLQ